MKYVFDNDGTLYNDNVVLAEFRRIFSHWGSKVMQCSHEDVWTATDKLKIKWGTEFSTIAFMKEFGLSFDEIVNETYLKVRLSPQNVVSEYSVLKSTLISLSGEKIVLTNNPSQFARRILDVLGVREEFVSIIGMAETDFRGKPHASAYAAVEAIFPDTKPEEFVIFDDSVTNLDAARSRGWKTVHICKDKPVEAQGHKQIATINALDTICL